MAPAYADIEDGFKAYENRKYQTAYYVLLPFANKGNAKAQHVVGRMLWYGNGVKKNEIKAVEYLLKSAKQGYVRAQLQLGYIYEFKISNAKLMGTKLAFEGASQPLDPKVGIKWLLAAARQGNMQAYGALSGAYCHGIGVVEDHRIAYGWLALSLGKHATNPDVWRGFSCGFDFEPTRGFVLMALQTAKELRRKYGLPGNGI